MIAESITPDYCPVHKQTPCACVDEPFKQFGDSEPINTMLIFERIVGRLQYEAYVAGLHADTARFFDVNNALWLVMAKWGWRAA